MSKHSPGPWHVNVTAADDLEINDADGRRVCIWYASVECLSPGDPDLIAAAPRTADRYRRLRNLLREIASRAALANYPDLSAKAAALIVETADD